MGMQRYRQGARPLRSAEEEVYLHGAQARHQNAKGPPPQPYHMGHVYSYHWGIKAPSLISVGNGLYNKKFP